MDEYVKSLKEYPELQDKLAAPSNDDGDGHRKSIYPEHLSPREILLGIKSGKFLQGTFYASR